MPNKNSSGFYIWDRLHEVIRWVLYIPAVFVTSFGAAILFNLLCRVRGDFEGIFLYLQTLINAGLCAVLFIWLALNLAPRMPKICAWLIFTLWSVFAALSIFRFFAIAFIEHDMSIQKSDVVELLQSVSWLVVGIYCLFHMGRKFNGNQHNI